MKHVSKSVLLWYSPGEMYALVTAVQDYPGFLPWCDRAEVLEQDERGMQARLHLVFGALRQSFTTRNDHQLDRAVTMSLVDGPFSVLEGAWEFVPIGPAQTVPNACRIEFNLRYEFANGGLDALLSPVFDRIANSLVDSFVQQAERVYGAR